MAKNYVIFFLLVITVPLMIGLNAWQSNKCGEIRNEIKTLEKNQENYIRENRTVVAEIADLLAAEKLETEARKMGLRKINPENVMLIIVGGKGREF